jgi:hypothetical protein
VVFVKKSSEGGGAPTLDILAARLRIVETELELNEKQVNMDGGHSFMAEPNLNCKFEVLENLVEPGKDVGIVFFDRFKLKKDKKGEWIFAKFSKLGNLIQVRYGPGWFDSDAPFEESDFQGFELIAQVEPKTDSKGKLLLGSVLNWRSMRRASVANERAVRKEQDIAQQEEDMNFESIPF